MTALTNQIIANKDLAAALADWTQTFAFCAGTLAIIRFFHEKRLERQGSARALYNSFMTSSVAYPELYGGAWSDGSLSSPELRQKYIYYMGSFLWAAEELLREFPKNSIWRETILVTVREHADYFMSSQFQSERRGYSKELIKLIGRGVKHA